MPESHTNGILVQKLASRLNTNDSRSLNIELEMKKCEQRSHKTSKGCFNFEYYMRIAKTHISNVVYEKPFYSWFGWEEVIAKHWI